MLRWLAAANPAAPAPMTTTDSCNEIITLTAINEMYKKINHTLIYYMYLTKKFNYFVFYFYWNPQAKRLYSIHLTVCIWKMQLRKCLSWTNFYMRDVTLGVIFYFKEFACFAGQIIYIIMVQVCLVVLELWYSRSWYSWKKDFCWWLTFWQHKQRNDISKDL